MLVCFRPEKVERVSLLWSVMYSLRFNMKNNVHSTINVQDHIAPTECLQYICSFALELPLKSLDIHLLKIHNIFIFIAPAQMCFSSYFARRPKN